MSDGARMSYPFALNLAERMVRLLAPACQRIEIAGSIRRQKQDIGDVEIVLIPRPTLDLFGGEGFGAYQISDILDQAGYILEKNGDHFKQAHLPKIAGPTVNFDIFLTTPAQWGVIFTIRTGSADFSHRLVTTKQQGGLLPSNMLVREGRIWTKGKGYDNAWSDYPVEWLPLETPEEMDIFKAIGLPWIEPKDRR